MDGKNIEERNDGPACAPPESENGSGEDVCCGGFSSGGGPQAGRFVANLAYVVQSVAIGRGGGPQEQRQAWSGADLRRLAPAAVGRVAGQGTAGARLRQRSVEPAARFRHWKSSLPASNSGPTPWRAESDFLSAPKMLKPHAVPLT
jgi:hypothetical protein